MSHDAQFTHAHMVRFDWPLAATPEATWAVLTDVRRLPAWYGDGLLEGKVGGTVRLMGGHIRGTVTQWQPPRKLGYSWNVFGPREDASPYPESYLTLELAPQDSGTLLTLTHLPVLERFVQVNAMGWHTYLELVDAAVRGTAIESRDAVAQRNARRYGVDLSNLPR